MRSPFGDHAKRDAVVALPRVGAMPRAMQMQDHVVPAGPARHRLDRGPADHEVDHHDARAELLREFGALVHVLHRAGRHVQVVPFELASLRLGAVHRLHREQEAVAPVHERLRVDVLVVLQKIEAAAQAFVDHPSIVFARQTELRLDRGAEQRPAILVEPFALDDDAGRRPLKRLQIRDGNAHVFEPQCLQRLEAEHVADDRRGQVRDRALFEQIEFVSDIREVLRLVGARHRHRLDAIRLRAIHVAGGEPVGPHHRPRRGRRFAGHRGGRFLGFDTGLRRDAKQRDHVGVFRFVVRLPVPHLAVFHHARRVPLARIVRIARLRFGLDRRLTEIVHDVSSKVASALPEERSA
ncbi:hypothetical protein OKW38_006884 [Paraburkholderia sp. MM5496-R1]